MALLLPASCLFLLTSRTMAVELSASDFSFGGELGSDGASISRLGQNHFNMVLSSAPGHPEWSNMCQFAITDHAAGNSLTLEPSPGGLREFVSWSYDKQNWHPITPTVVGGKTTLVFPTFTQNQVYVGGEVPRSYENMISLVDQWKTHPDVSVHNIGASVEGRAIYRVTVTAANGSVPLASRWVHHVVNQHCYEYNSQWRIAGMVDWLLSAEAAEYRENNACHFVVMMNVDGPHNGFGRVNRQGIDMNRAYSVSGSESNPAVESRIVQRDLEQINSVTPITTTWSMHTWEERDADPHVRPGPEMGTIVGPWTEMRDIIEANDTGNEISTLVNLGENNLAPTHWMSGTHIQFGVSAFLVEGNSGLYTKEENMHVGEVLMKSIGEFYGRPVSTPEPSSWIMIFTALIFTAIGRMVLRQK
jgi:hypothetical protein